MHVVQLSLSQSESWESAGPAGNAFRTHFRRSHSYVRTEILSADGYVLDVTDQRDDIAELCTWYRYVGGSYVAILTRPGEYTMLGIGDSPESACRSLDGTPVQFSGDAIERALDWAIHAGWLDTRDGLAPWELT